MKFRRPFVRTVVPQTEYATGVFLIPDLPHRFLHFSYWSGCFKKRLRRASFGADISRFSDWLLQLRSF